jgi:hypothetical protein
MTSMRNLAGYLILGILIFFFQEGFSDQEYWTKGFRNKREFESSPPAFEKIYVNPCQIVTFPDGIYLRHEDGQLEKVRSLSQDCGGSYVLLIKTQCPLCGRCYAGKDCPEGMGCPLYEVEVLPNLWGPP